MKKLFFLTTLLLLTCVVGSASAGDVWYSNAMGNNLWSDPCNWGGDALPTGADNANHNKIIDPCATNTGDLLLITDGAVGSSLKVGLWNGPYTPYTCKVQMDSGNALFGNVIALGGSDTNEANGQLDMYGGTLSANGQIWIGDAGDGTVNLHDGLLYTRWALNIPNRTYPSNTGTATVNLYGGTFHQLCGMTMTAEGKINIEGGTLQLLTYEWWDAATKATNRDTIQGYIDSGWIVAYDGVLNPLKGLLVTVGGDGSMTITAVNPDPYVARDPETVAAIGGVSVNTTLAWTPGIDVATHEVYLGTDFDDVNDADNTDVTGIYLGSYAAPANSVPKEDLALELAETYYWRVDEVNSTGVIYPGDVWSFAVQAYVSIDNFDGYASEAAMLAVWDVGASDTYLYMDPCDVFGVNPQGFQSMKINYYNYASAYYCEAGKAIAAADSDFTSGGETTVLNLLVHGEPGDFMPERTYVALKSADGNEFSVVFDDPCELILEAYQDYADWDILLQDFADGGVDLENITNIYVGLGNRETPVYNEVEGFLYVDDIRLSPSYCVSDEVPSDLTGDCFTDLADIDLLNYYWLDGDETVGVGTMPADANLVVWYEFDESSGTVASDSGPGGWDANSEKDGYWEDSNGPDGSGCINFDGTFRVQLGTNDVNLAFANVDTELSFAMWVFCDEIFPSTGWNNVAFHLNAVNPGNMNRVLMFSVPTPSVHDAYASMGATFISGLYSDNLWWGGCEPENYMAWHHWAGTKDSDTGDMKFYNDGKLVLEMTDQTMPFRDPLTGHGISDLSIGASLASLGFVGKIDDVRVYDYELSQGEIVSIMGAGSVVNPMALGKDPYEDGKIDLKDFAVIGDAWLTESLFGN